MSERVSEAPLEHQPTAGRAWTDGSVKFVAVVLATYALVGLAAGWVWHELWQSAEGVVVQHQWYATGAALREDFSGTGLYVLIATGAGLALGVLFAILGGVRPVVTLVACAIGSALAGWLMLTMGEWLGPADPQELAKTLDDGATLPSALRVSGLSPLFAFTLGTLGALALVFTVFQGNSPERRFDEEPRG
jgi:hypothetical protein